MTLHRHSSQVSSLGKCVDDTPIEIDLIALDGRTPHLPAAASSSTPRPPYDLHDHTTHYHQGHGHACPTHLIDIDAELTLSSMPLGPRRP
jgi:hypothetical protein